MGVDYVSFGFGVFFYFSVWILEIFNLICFYFGIFTLFDLTFGGYIFLSLDIGSFSDGWCLIVLVLGRVG